MGCTIINAFVRTTDVQAVADAAREFLRPYNTAAYQAEQRAFFERVFLAHLPPGAEDADLATQLAELRSLVVADDPAVPAVYLAPAQGGWVGVFDSVTAGNPTLSPELVRLLSRRLRTAAIAFHVFDGDFLAYSLARNGEVLDEYHSDPDYFGQPLPPARRKALRGKPGVVASVCETPAAALSIARVIRRPDIDGQGQLQGISAILGIVDSHCAYRGLADDHRDGPPPSGFHMVTWGEIHGAG